jgi:hypothetical protein
MIKSVDEEPHIRLTRWGVLQDIFGYRLVGVQEGSTGGRVTSPVVSWDSHALVATTESGRQYRLVGDSDHDVAVMIIKAHAVKSGFGLDEVALADVWELEMLGPQPGEGLH